MRAYVCTCTSTITPCMHTHTVYWYTNTYTVPLAHKWRSVCPWDPYWQVLQGASPFPLSTVPCTLGVFARPYRAQLPATLRLKSIFHKQGQRAWAGQEYKQLPRRNRATWGSRQGSSENCLCSEPTLTEEQRQSPSYVEGTDWGWTEQEHPGPEKPPLRCPNHTHKGTKGLYKV